jgi:hypothetical protein
MKNKEQIYDEQIAPLLMQVGKLCQDNGLSIVCAVEWEPGDYGSTRALEADASEFMRKLYHATQNGFGPPAFRMTVVQKE